MNKYAGDMIIEVVGGHHKYQIINCFILLFVGSCADFYYFYISLMVTTPMVEFKKGDISAISTFNYDYCTSDYEFILREDLSKQTWITKDIICSKFLVSLITASICFGALMGAIFIKFLQPLGNRRGIVFNCFIIMASTCILLINNYYVILISNVLFGFGQICIFIMRNSFVSEITDKKYRSYFMKTQMISGITSSIIYFTTYNYNVKWTIMYPINCAALLLFVILLIIFSRENPRFYLVKNEITSLKESAKFMNAFNKKISVIDFETEIDKILDETSCCNTNEDTEKIQVVNGITKEGNEKTLDQKDKRNFIIFLILFFLYCINIIAITLEIKFYSSKIDSHIFYYVNILMLFLYLIVSCLSNLPFLGRKKTLIIFLSSIFVMRMIKIFYWDNYILFLLIRAVLYSSQIPMHILITESFSTKDRVKNYGLIYICGKIASLINPFIIEFLSTMVYDIILSSFVAFCIIVLIFWVDETLNLSMKDI